MKREKFEFTFRKKTVFEEFMEKGGGNVALYTVRFVVSLVCATVKGCLYLISKFSRRK